MTNYVPARYIGNHAVSLPSHIQFKNVDGSMRKEKNLYAGDELLMPSDEILGQSFFRSPSGEMFYLGAGRVIKPEHVGLSLEQLVQAGYEFHQGRQDFEAIVTPDFEQPAAQEVD